MGRFVDYAMYRVRLLRHHGIEPYIVFDGGPLPAKKKTEVSREKYVLSSLLPMLSSPAFDKLADAQIPCREPCSSYRSGRTGTFEGC
jgi:exonuclease-1